MKLPITIEYNSGEKVTYVAQPPEWQKWEKDRGLTISQAQEKMGISDLMFLAYHAHKREAAGKAVSSFLFMVGCCASWSLPDFDVCNFYSTISKRRFKKNIPSHDIGTNQNLPPYYALAFIMKT